MANVFRTTAVWTGFQGAPGYTKFSWIDLADTAAYNAAGSAMKNYFDNFTLYMSNAWSIQVQPGVQVFDMQTGVLLREETMTTVPGATTGTGVGVIYAGGSGFCMSWKTGTIFNGRRVQGRTFHVPAQACFEADGTLHSTLISNGATAANLLINTAGANFAIWARQYSKPAPGSSEKPVQVNGVAVAATAGLVKDMASQLRSRRI